MGTYVEFRNGPRFHRTGAALGLAPDALTFGLRWARMAFDALTPALGDITEMMTAAISRIEDLVPRFEEVVRDYDHHLWQEVQPVDLEAFVLVTRHGPPRWFIRAGMTEWVRPAVEPGSLPAGQRDALGRLVERARAMVRDDGECMSIRVALPDRRVIPKPGGAWQFSPQMFGHPGFRWDAPSEPRGGQYEPMEDDPQRD
jgi:hypothetical protein